MLSSKIGRWTIASFGATMCACAFLVPAAFSANSAKIVGSATAGKSVFSSNCSSCHTLKAAGATGAIGPNLDTAAKSLTEAQIITAIQKGGASIMTKAQAAKYSIPMSAYKGALSATEINNIAAFVYTSTHK